VGAGFIEIAGDEAGGEAEGAGGLHHEQGEVAAGSRAGFQRLRGRLGAFLRAGGIGEALVDGLGDRLQQGQGALLAGGEAAGPGIDEAGRVRQLALGEAGEVRRLLRRVGEGVVFRCRIERGARQGGAGGVVGELQLRGDREAVGAQGLRPGQVADGVAEDVMRPACGLRRRVDREGGCVQAQVVAVLRADHQAVRAEGDREVTALIDQHGHRWAADIYVCNADAAAFRGLALQRPRYRPERLDKLQWTLAPFTIYLGVQGRLDNVYHHNYFLGDNFHAYAEEIFRTQVAPEKPYYYLNVSSHTDPTCAPPGCENLFILCPVPDRRYKPQWDDAEQLADTIVADLSARIGYDLQAHTLTRTVMTPIDWEEKFRLYRGSGLGLAHGLNQVGALRPANKDEHFGNLYYVGASTIPGTGLPIVVISSRLVTERIQKEHAPTAAAI